MSAYWAFVGAALVVLLIPGLGVVYVVTRCISQGRRAGLLSVLGLTTGALVHVLVATVGLSALLLLGLSYLALSLLTDGAYALLAASIGSRFNDALLRGPMLRYVSGSVYLGLGVCTALISRQP